MRRSSTGFTTRVTKLDLPPSGKWCYDDVGTDLPPVQSHCEKCAYSDLKEDFPSSPIENSSFIDKDS